ncbi:MAG: hypothetical protein WKF37_15755 [Bryobacteraceae bacterium]
MTIDPAYLASGLDHDREVFAMDRCVNIGRKAGAERSVRKHE